MAAEDIPSLWSSLNPGCRQLRGAIGSVRIAHVMMLAVESGADCFSCSSVGIRNLFYPQLFDQTLEGAV